MQGESALQYSTVMTDEGVVEQIVSSEIGLSAAAEAGVETVVGVEMDVARGEETEVVETEQIITYDVEEETKTVVKSKENIFSFDNLYILLQTFSNC